MITSRLPEDLEMFLNMPDTLYLLRMNADGTDVEVEEHKIVPYPDFDRLFQQLRHAERPVKAGDIRSWGFGKLMDETLYQYDMGSNSTLKKMGDDEEIPLAVQYDLDVNTLKSRVLAKRIEMTHEKAGEDRVADYSIRKEHIDKAQTEARKALKEYAECSAEAWRMLQNYIKSIEGCDCSPAKTVNIRRERSLNNLVDYCSTSYTYYVFEKPFMKLVYRLGNHFRVDPILTVYDIPCWEFDFMNGGLSARRNNQLLSDRKSFADRMKDVFKEPENATDHRNQIKKQIEKTLGISIANETIFYDPASECYILNEDAECRMLGKLIPQKAEDITYIAKYKLISYHSHVFRGHSSNKYQLIPSALRPESKNILDRMALCSIDESEYDLEFYQVVKELYLLRHFYKRCDKNGLLVDNIDIFRNSYFDDAMLDDMKKIRCWLPKEMWPLASLAQHYGLFTRLLDWTHDIYTALFFCVEDYLEGKHIPEGTSNIELWMLDIERVSEMEKEGFPLRLVQPVYYGNPNLYAQQGMFTLWQVGIKDYQSKVNRFPLDELITQRINNDSSSLPLLLRIVLPGDSAKQLYDHINKLGYNASRLYPGYNGVANSLKHDFFLFEERLSSNKVMIAKR